MPRVIFLIYHGMGHINACLRPARILANHYHVIFAGVGFFKGYVETQGFPYYSLKSVPFGLSFETWVNTIAKKKFTYLAALHDRWTNKLFKDRYEELTKMVEEINPHAVLIDTMQNTDFVVLHPILKSKGIRVGFFNTMLSLVIENNKPPLNSFVQPGNKKTINRDIRNIRFRKMLKDIGQEIKFLGHSDKAIIKRAIRQSKIPSRFPSEAYSIFGVSLNHIPEFITAPHEFDFNEYHPRAHQHFIGFMVDEKRVEVADSSFEAVWKLIESRKASTKLIYCSLGTVESKKITRVTSFFRKLVEATSAEDHLLIVSIPAKFNEITRRLANSDRVRFIKAAPQLKILSKSDLFITHGGLNSIKESIYACVPMLVYPLDLRLDQPGNATRVVYHGLGLHGHFVKDSVDDIRLKIRELLKKDHFKARIRQMKEADASYSPEKFLFLFQGLRAVQ